MVEKLLQEDAVERVQLSCETIEQELENGKISGSFEIKGRTGKVVKGSVLVSDPRIQCSETVFQGENIKISYYFDGSSMCAGEKVSGSFWLITNRGEYEIPYTFSYPKQEIRSSLGEIKNLFHFANLARTDWQEALRLYFSPAFLEILKTEDSRYRQIYRGLSGSPKEQYMDEFLHSIHKKTPVMYEMDKEEISLDNLKESVCVEMVIQKKGWGYVCLGAEAEGDFLQLEKNRILEEDFKGNMYSLPVYIDVKKLHQGKNWGEILLSSPYETWKIPVLISQNQHHRMRSVIEKRRNAKWLKARLTKSYIEFKTKKMSVLRFKKESEEILEALQKSEERNPLHKLYAAHLYVTAEKYHEAKWMLDRAKKNIQEERDPVIYAYYLYITTLITEDMAYVLEVKEQIETLYHAHEQVWQIAWLWMYLSKELHGNAQQKWNFLKEVFQKHCTSPVMYMEAILLLEYQPTLLMELSETEIRLLRFGQKKGMLSEQVKGIVRYLSLKEKEFSLPVYQLLTEMAKEQEDAELLQAICSLLIKGNKIGSAYFPWYEKAVLAELKLTRLYEYYMMSLDRENPREIPRMVLMYFSYQSEISGDYAAYLYRYIYENREWMEEMYLAYAPGMERFLLKQLYSGKIDQDLGYLYEHVLLVKMMTQDNAQAMVKVMFTHLVQENVRSGDRLIVIHPQSTIEEVTLCAGESAKIQLYGRAYFMCRQDQDGNRFLWKEDILPKAFMNTERTVSYIRAWVQDNRELALYLCDSSGDWQKITAENEPHFRFLSECDSIAAEKRQEIRSSLLDFYYAEDRMESLDACLEEYTLDMAAVEKRRELIHYLVIRGYYKKAYDFVREYGPENIEAKDLVRIAAYFLEQDEGEDPTLLWYIYTAFCKGKYHVDMLHYLCRYYRGSSKSMYQIFKAAQNFDLEVYDLCERILMQILTSKTDIEEETEVFKAYVAGGADSDVEAAYLTYRSVEYMRDDRRMEPYLLLDIGRVCQREYPLPLVTRLAYLRYFAEQETERERAEKILLQKFLQEIVIEKDIPLPFMHQYADIPGMEAMADRSLISYKTTPKKRVVIHYLKGEERAGYCREEMREVYFGVYVKEFVLFYGEKIPYYITEEEENQEQLTQSGVLQKEESWDGTGESRYQMIDEMAIGEALEDPAFVSETLEKYWKREFVSRKAFQL